MNKNKTKIVEEEVKVVVTLTIKGSKWVLASTDEPDATEYYTSKAIALDMFEKVLQISEVPWRKRNELVKEAMKLKI